MQQFVELLIFPNINVTHPVISASLMQGFVTTLEYIT